MLTTTNTYGFANEDGEAKMASPIRRLWVLGWSSVILTGCMNHETGQGAMDVVPPAGYTVLSTPVGLPDASGSTNPILGAIIDPTSQSIQTTGCIIGEIKSGFRNPTVSQTVSVNGNAGIAASIKNLVGLDVNLQLVKTITFTADSPETDNLINRRGDHTPIQCRFTADQAAHAVYVVSARRAKKISYQFKDSSGANLDLSSGAALLKVFTNPLALKAGAASGNTLTYDGQDMYYEVQIFTGLPSQSDTISCAPNSFCQSGLLPSYQLRVGRNPDGTVTIEWSGLNPANAKLPDATNLQSGQSIQYSNSVDGNFIVTTAFSMSGNISVAIDLVGAAVTQTASQ